MAKLNDKTKVRLWIIAILVVAMVFGIVDYPYFINKGIDGVNAKLNTQISKVKEVPFHLGLDLQGGTHLVYEADLTGIDSGEEGSSVEGVRDVIERRVNALGVAEPIVQTNQSRGKWRVIVELAGVSDVHEAINMIGETPLLEFKEENLEPPRELTPEEKADLDKYNKDAKTKVDELLKELKAGADFVTLVKENSNDRFTSETGGDLGYLTDKNTEHKELYDTIIKKNIAEPGFVQEIIKTDNGYNLISVTDIRDGEFQIKANHILICYEGAASCNKDTLKEDALKKIEELKEQANPDNFVELAKENSTEPGADSSGGDLGFFGKGVMVPEFEEAAFNLKNGQISDVVETQFGYHLIFKTGEQTNKEYKVSRLFVNTKIETDILPPQEPWINTNLSGKQLKRSLVEFDQNTNQPQVTLEFNDEGKQLFGEITARNVGKPVAIFLDEIPISIPRVNEEIKDGSAVISGAFDLAEARLLSQRLNAGALPVPINLISQQTVGASLGHESLQKSLVAALIALLLLMILMIACYRLSGVLAVIALLVYASVILFFFKVIPVTLTLSGIAGFILSIGMAVDANVLIFERLKEELLTGKPLGSSVDEGFKRAWSSIRDGNVSTLITCFILAWFGTSMIKGFAITLGLGVLISMFSAVIVTRYFLKYTLQKKGIEKKMWLFGINKK